MASDTYTNTLGLLLMGTGNDNNTWGALANSSVFQIAEDAIANFLAETVTGGTLDLSGTAPPAGPSQARYAAIVFSGTLASGQIVKVPNLTKFWVIQNNTSGAFTLTIQTPSGAASTAIPQNSGWQVVHCDGNNNIVVWPFNTIQIQMPDGSAAAPAYSDVNETNSGLYRVSAGVWGFSILGNNVFSVGASGPQFADGTVALPGIGFSNEPGSGLYRIGTGDAGFTILGAKAWEATTRAFLWTGGTSAGSDVTPASFSTEQDNYAPITGTISAVGSLVGGTLYVAGTYYDVPLTGGTGSGAVASKIVVSGGAVTSVTVGFTGKGYVGTDVLSASNANLGGAGSGFSITVNSVTGILGASCVRLNPTATCLMTGLVGGAAGVEVELLNIGTATIQFPANSGSSTAANRFATAFNLAPGQSITLRYDATSSLWRPKNVATAIASCCIGAVSNDLLIVNHSGTENTKVDITCGEVVMTDSSGNAIKFESVSVTIDSTVTISNGMSAGTGGCDSGTRGANTDYYIYLASDGTNVFGVLSTSATSFSLANAPNFVYSKRVGYQHTDGSSNFKRIRQKGKRGGYVVTAATNTTAYPTVASGSTSSAWVQESLSGLLPSTAIVAHVELFAGDGDSPSNVGVAPNGGFGTGTSGSWNVPVPTLIYTSSGGSSGQGKANGLFGSIFLETLNLYYFSNLALSGNANILLLLGWDDNI